MKDTSAHLCSEAGVPQVRTYLALIRHKCALEPLQKPPNLLMARLVMDNFDGTTFVKLFMYNASEGLFPFHSDVLPTNGERKIRVSISLSDMMPPFTVCAGRVRVRSLRCTVSAASL